MLIEIHWGNKDGKWVLHTHRGNVQGVYYSVFQLFA